jgi:AbrB family looped-hinge helix DNA binding protein
MAAIATHVGSWEKSAMSTAATTTYSVRFSTRGRVTIPAALRRMHGIKGGSRVVCEVTPAGILLKPIATKRR